jgi:hypothetical protein
MNGRLIIAVCVVALRLAAIDSPILRSSQL